MECPNVGAKPLLSQLELDCMVAIEDKADASSINRERKLYCANSPRFVCCKGRNTTRRASQRKTSKIQGIQKLCE
jgi:hypothetical protein